MYIINYGVSLSKHILSNNNSTLLHWKYYKAGGHHKNA